MVHLMHSRVQGTRYNMIRPIRTIYSNIVLLVRNDLLVDTRNQAEWPTDTRPSLVQRGFTPSRRHLRSVGAWQAHISET